MYRGSTSALALVAVLALASPLRAEDFSTRAGSVSAFALGTPLASSVATGDLAALEVTRPAGTQLGSIRYQPRRRPPASPPSPHPPAATASSPSRSSGFGQLHAGFFGANQDSREAFVAGIRAGSSMERILQIGVGVDFGYRYDETVEVISEEPVPGGNDVRRINVLAESRAYLLPVMATLQLTPFSDFPIAPYAGVGAGYEWLFLTAEDFVTAYEYEATFGGWGWQAWGGVALKLARHTRLTAEVFVNGADLGRDVYTEDTGAGFREIVEMDGVGMRFGVRLGQ